MIEFLNELPDKLGEVREIYFLLGGGFGYGFIYDIANSLDKAMVIQEELVKRDIPTTIKKYKIEAINIDLSKDK